MDPRIANFGCDLDTPPKPADFSDRLTRHIAREKPRIAFRDHQMALAHNGSDLVRDRHAVDFALLGGGCGLRPDAELEVELLKPRLTHLANTRTGQEADPDDAGGALILIGALLTLVFSGIHIAVALGLCSMLGLFLMTGDVNGMISFASSTAYEALRDYIFAVIPLFMLMGEFMGRSGAVTDIYVAINRSLKRVKARLGFYRHAFIYVAVISGLSLLAFSQGKAWSLWPTAGWGFGLLMHGLGVFGFGAGSDLRQRLVEQERQRLYAASNGRQP